MEAESLRLGLSKNTLWRWANGGIEPKPWSFQILMDFLGVDLPTLGGYIAETRFKFWLRQHPEG